MPAKLVKVLTFEHESLGIGRHAQLLLYGHHQVGHDRLASVHNHNLRDQNNKSADEK
jgi:hypothetical protein